MRLLSSVFTTLILAAFAFAGTTLQPTTTLKAETGNNTSAANSFVSQSNGNLGAGNVSKLTHRSLMYSGSTTKLYVHFMGWFGQSNHMNVGYSSADAAQVARQVADMSSRGFDGAIVDWYGPENTVINNTTILLRDAAVANGNFQFAITEDGGALKKCAATAGCDVTEKLIKDLTYAWKTFQQSAAYARINGQPVVFFFSVDAYAIDWVRAKASVPGSPLFVFRNSVGFSKATSDGAFSWVGISSDPTSMGLSYLDTFYSTALKYPSDFPFGSAYKGFNDTLAAWSEKRIVNQQCGQTWLATWARAARYYSPSKQLYALQAVTWNDYEEGTSIESGIDNCVTVSGAVNGSTLTWSITGQENTVDHYTVFISLDGENLMPLADVSTGVGTLDLSTYGFGPAQYTIYVKAIGKPSLSNKISGPIGYTVLNKPPEAALSVTPGNGIAPVTVAVSAAGSTDPDGSIAAYSLDFGDGAVSAEATASHMYSAPGTYTITAKVTDDLGAIATRSATVVVVANQPPVAKLSVSPATGIAPLTVSASAAASYDADGKTSSTNLSWGDGTTTTGADGSHVYEVPGTYTVAATVTDDRGATSTATVTVSVLANQAPAATLSLTPTSGVAPVSVTASTSGSSDADGSIVSTTINWGDGASTTAASASHVYGKAGIFTVTATVKDDRGATSSVSAKVNVEWGVTISAPINNTTVSSPVRVVAKASSSVPITAMKIYVDYVAVYSINAASLDTWVKMDPGTRRVVVQAWDQNGVVYKSTIFINAK